MSERINRKLFLAFTELQILYHASNEPINGTWIINEISLHGYNISPGTVYPILNNMEKRKLLTKKETVVDGKVRKYYTTTREGKLVFEDAKKMARTLMKEIDS